MADATHERDLPGMERGEDAGWDFWRNGRNLCGRTRLRHGRRGPRGGCRLPRLRLDGSVVLRVNRRRRPDFGAVAEFVQRDARLPFPFDDLTGITVTATRMIQVQGFISGDSVLQQLLVGEEAALF